MDIQEIEKKILAHKLSVTEKEYDFKSFNDLCRALEIEPKDSGGQRKGLETQFKRFFNYERFVDKEKKSETYKLKITETYYDNPKPYETNKKGLHWTDLNRAIASLVMLNTKLLDTEQTKYSILKSIGIFHEEPAYTLAGWDTRHTYDAYKQKMYGGLKSAMKQFAKHEYVFFTEKYYANKDGETVILTKKEISKYKSLSKETCNDLGVKNSWQATYIGKYSKFNQILNEKLLKEMGISDVSQKYEITAGSKYNIAAFKASYPGASNLKAKALDNFIKNDAQERFWNCITFRTADKYLKAIGIVSKESFEADIAEIKNNG